MASCVKRRRRVGRQENAKKLCKSKKRKSPKRKRKQVLPSPEYGWGN